MVCEEENQKEHGLIQLQKQFTDIVSLFTAVTGIKLHLLSAQEYKIKPCSICRLKEDRDCKNIVERLAKNHSHCKNGLYLCSNGMFRILIPVLRKKQLVYSIISEPLSFSQGADIAPNTSPHEHLTEHPVVPPFRLIKIARLLRHAIGGALPQKEKEEIKYKLLDSAKDGKITLARGYLEQLFLKIIAKNGVDFSIIKANCLDLILTLEELTADTLKCEPPKNSERIFSALCRADTIGKLKECVNAAAEQFISVAFYPTLQKHTALIREAILYIQEHYKKKITEELVASLVYISPSYFSKIFKENVGISFKEYVNHIRIEKAKALLLRPELSITQIAGMVGYENRSYFGKIFKTKTGTSPAKYRQYHI